MKTQRLLHDSLLAAADESGAKTAVATQEESLAYADVLDRASRLARSLQEHGLERGDRVAILMDNTAACTISIFAASLAGGVFIVVNPQTKADKLAYILNDSEAAVLLTEGTLARVFAPAVEQAPRLKAVVCASPGEGSGPVLDLDELIAGAEPAPRNLGTIPVDLAALIYTSGSTGNPKGVMMTHANMVFTAGSLIEYLRLGPDDRILSVLPLAFDYGLYQWLMTVRLGATLALERSFVYPARTLMRLEEEGITVFPGVPTVFATLLGMRAEKEFPSVTRITNTAAALPPTFHEGLAERFPNALVFRMYGLTECKRVSYLEPELVHEKPTSVGRAIPGTETFVLDTEGRPVAPGETGVLYVRGPHVMAGYWGAPELSAHMLKDGPVPGERMLCTHDFFTVDEDGLLYFIGRSDDIIKTRGEKVSPIEVENALFSIEGVQEAAVLGFPDEVLGEAIRAYVVLEDGASIGEQGIIAACRTRLESFMVPKEVVLLDELPKTATGKIRKKSLLEPAG
ncbi:MAG: class I adenylate-forming enzyme family protein [Gaiellaceae bacterium]